MRCISRSHMAWKSCRRWPITRRQVQRHGVAGLRDGPRSSSHQRLARKRDHLGFERRGGRQGEPVGRNQRRPAHRLRRRPFFDQHVLFVAAHLHGKRQPQAAARDQVDAVGRVAQVEQFRARWSAACACRAPARCSASSAVSPFKRSAFDHGVPFSSPAWRWCGCAAATALGDSRKHSAAACSRRTWFSICSSSASIGTRVRAATGSTGRRSTKKRAATAAAFTISFSPPAAAPRLLRSRVAAPKARQAHRQPEHAQSKHPSATFPSSRSPFRGRLQCTASCQSANS